MAPRKLSDTDIAEAKQLYQAGVALAAIAKKFKVHQTTIYRAVHFTKNGNKAAVPNKALTDARKVNLINAVSGLSEIPDSEILDMIRVILAGY